VPSRFAPRRRTPCSSVASNSLLGQYLRGPATSHSNDPDFTGLGRHSNQARTHLILPAAGLQGRFDDAIVPMPNGARAVFADGPLAGLAVATNSLGWDYTTRGPRPGLRVCTEALAFSPRKSTDRNGLAAP